MCIPQRSILTRALGTTEVPRVEYAEIDLAKGDIFLLCTDGLTVEAHGRGNRSDTGLAVRPGGQGGTSSQPGQRARRSSTTSPWSWSSTMVDRRTFQTTMVPLAMGLSGLCFLLPALALPAGRTSLLTIGLATLVIQGVTPLIFQRFALPLDRVIYAVSIVLTGLSLAMITRLQIADPGLGSISQKQLLGLAFGMVAMAGGAVCGQWLLTLCHYRYLLLSLALILLGLTVPFGEIAGGSRAWLRLGGLHVQPSEVARPIVIFFLASYLGQYQPLLRALGPGTLPLWRRRWLLGPILAMWALSLAELLLQRDLGTAFLYFASFLVLLYLASGRLSYLVGGTGLGRRGVHRRGLPCPPCADPVRWSGCILWPSRPVAASRTHEACSPWRQEGYWASARGAAFPRRRRPCIRT